MELIHYFVLILFTLSSIINSIRWSRIAQREHYINGYITKFYFRWIKLFPFNKVLFFLLFLLLLSSLWTPIAAILLAILNLIAPLGLSFKSRTAKVIYTDRLKRLNILYILLIIIFSLVSVLNDLGYFVAMFANLFSFYIFDLSMKLIKNYEKNKSSVFVDSAAIKLKEFSGPIIAITGSYAKTTTKNVMHQIFTSKYKTFVTPESFNNRLGIAKSINESFNISYDVALFEMGTYGFGEIREMCSWIKPHISVITGIAPVHLERMSTLENILEAKSEIVDLTGTVVINGDDELLLNEARLWTGQKMVIDCSTSSNQAAVYVDYRDEVHSIYIGGQFIISVKGPELLQLSIALSVGVLVALEMDVKSFFTNDLVLLKTQHRQTELIGNKGQTIIDNSFNSNPISYKASLAQINKYNSNGKKYLITPGLIELGSQQFSYNYEFALDASKVFDEVFIIGYTNISALRLGFDETNTNYKIFKNRDLAVSDLNSYVSKDDIVLFENDLPDHHP
ncbi:MAG: Mur ligase family protein [Actinomycetota bacterium]|nr:Mur ligase family protein [Actinomycetota bacterium]MDA3013148.1 Mur ligase family protein [Actinomycetota bacterium]